MLSVDFMYTAVTFTLESKAMISTAMGADKEFEDALTLSGRSIHQDLDMLIFP